MLTKERIDEEIKNLVEHGTNRADIACLADLLICRDRLTEHERITAQGSEFAACVNGKCFSEILPLLEELVETLHVLQPKLYESFMQRLR